MSEKQATLIIPALNEEKTIGEVIDGIRNHFQDRYEIVVVNDGSKDRTGQIAREKAALVVEHPQRKGYGAAWKTGVRKATSEIVVFYDGDGQHDPRDIPRIVELLGSYDMVVGARENGSHAPLSRRPGKKLLSLLANYLTKSRIPDLNSGLRGFHRSVLVKYLHLLPDGFSASTTVTLVMMKRGYRIHYLPIQVKPRRGKSSVNQIRDGGGTMMLMIRMITLFDPLRVFLPASASFLVSGCVLGIYYLVQGRGLTVASLFLLLTGILLFFFGLLADQVSAMRLEKYE